MNLSGYPFRINRNTKILVKSYELDLLEQILIHRVMHSKSIHDYIQQLSGKPLNSGSISNRLTLFVKSRILKRMKINISLNRADFSRNYYKLDIKGFRCLIESGRFQYEGFKNRYRLSAASIIPSPHTDAMSILANKIYLECLKNLEPKSFEHARGIEVTKKMAREWVNELKEFPRVIPDWVFEKEKHLICVEMDTGKQNQNIIGDKIKNYIKLFEKISEKGYRISLVFAVLDDSIDIVEKYKKENRIKRVGSLKENISSLFEGVLQPSIFNDTYVASAKRIPTIVKDLLDDEVVNQHDIIQYWLECAKVIFKEKENFKVKRELIQLNHGDATSSLVITLKNNSQHVIPLFGREAIIMRNVIQNHLEDAAVWNSNNPSAERVIVVCYEDSLSAEHDVYGLEIPLNTKLYKTDISTWANAALAGTGPPDMISMLGPYSQKWVRR
jgi:hypothetical protein